MRVQDTLRGRAIPPLALIFLVLATISLIAAFPGLWMPPLAAHLHHLDAAAFLAQHARLAPLIAGSSLLFFALGATCFARRDRLQIALAQGVKFLAPLEQAFCHDAPNWCGLTFRQILGWCCAIAALLLLLYAPTLRQAFFAYDDFEIISVMHAHPLREAIFMLHGDHTMPLLRVEFSLMHALFGFNTFFYNAALLLMLGALLFFGVLLLKELGAGFVAAALFMVLAGAGQLWGEFLGGYYTISTYLQQTVLSVLACWAYLRWLNTGRTGLAAASIIALMLATLLDISGFWVVGGFAVFVLAVKLGKGPGGWPIWWRRHRWLAAGVMAACAVAILFNAYVFLVLSPHGFLNMSGTPPTIFQRVEEMWYYISTALLLPLMPSGYWKLPAPYLTALLLAVDLGVLTLVLAARRLPRALWWIALAGLVILMGNGAMVAIGRPQLGLGFPWQTKYIGSGHAWWLISLCLLAGAAWTHASWTRRVVLSQWYLAAAIFYVAIQVGGGMAAAAITHNAAGYPGYLAQAQQRREAIGDLRAAIAPLYEREDGPTIPLLMGQSIEARHPGLFRYDLICYRDFIQPPGRSGRFIQNNAMADKGSGDRDTCHAAQQGPDSLLTVASLRGAVSDGFRKNISNNPVARDLYLAPIALAFHASPCEPAGEPIDSDGSATLNVRDGGWDPERAHLLRFTVRYDGASSTARIALPFASGFSSGGASWLDIPAGQTLCLSTDLLQLYGYALPRQVRDLRMRLVTPGKYVVTGPSLKG